MAWLAQRATWRGGRWTWPAMPSAARSKGGPATKLKGFAHGAEDLTRGDVKAAIADVAKGQFGRHGLTSRRACGPAPRTSCGTRSRRSPAVAC